MVNKTVGAMEKCLELWMESTTVNLMVELLALKLVDLMVSCLERQKEFQLVHLKENAKVASWGYLKAFEKVVGLEKMLVFLMIETMAVPMGC
jgi:hypothetical protein